MKFKVGNKVKVVKWEESMVYLPTDKEHFEMGEELIIMDINVERESYYFEDKGINGLYEYQIELVKDFEEKLYDSAIIKKPPRGLVTRTIWQEIVLDNRKEERIANIESAIERYVKAKKDIPYEWLEELNDYKGATK